MTSTTPGHDHAIDTFCREHWHRLHAAACRRGCAAADAEDAVQELFLSLTRRVVLDEVMLLPEKDQAAYLALRLRCVLHNRWRDAHRQRRGGRMLMLALEDVPEPPCHETPATHFDRVWLAHCIAAAVSRLSAQIRQHDWQQIGPMLLDHGGSPLDATRRVALHRARKKLRDLVRQEMNGSFKDWSNLLPALND